MQHAPCDPLPTRGPGNNPFGTTLTSRGLARQADGTHGVVPTKSSPTPQWDRSEHQCQALHARTKEFLLGLIGMLTHDMSIIRGGSPSQNPEKPREGGKQAWSVETRWVDAAPSANSATSQDGKTRKAKGNTHTHTDMAAEGTMPGGLGGPKGPVPTERRRSPTFQCVPRTGTLSGFGVGWGLCTCIYIYIYM